MASEDQEYLNHVIQDLVDGLNSVADKVRDGSRCDIADALTELAGKICEHWPECLVSIPEDSKD